MVFNSLNSFNIYNNTNNKLDSDINSIKHIIKKTLKVEKVKKVTFNIIIINDEEMHKLNKEYRGIDKTTDVISFALEDVPDEGYNLEERVLGDIYISIDKAKVQAKEYNQSLNKELQFLAVHGLLHLLGYNHVKKEEEKIMFGKQELILNGKR